MHLFRIDCVPRVEFDGGEWVVGERPTVPGPLYGRRGLAAEPDVVADGAALLQGDVVHALALQVRRDCSGEEEDKLFALSLKNFCGETHGIWSLRSWARMAAPACLARPC